MSPAGPAPTDLVLQGPALTPAAVAAFRAAIGHARCERRAGAVRLRGVDAAAAAPVAASLAAAWRCDAALVPARWRLSSFRLLALDMDSTLIRDESIDQIARRCGLGAQVAAITEAAMRGEATDYADSLRQRVALLGGCDAAAVAWVGQHRLRLNPGAERLVAAAHGAGLHTLLVSGGFGVLARRLQQRLRIGSVVANELGMRDGRLTGAVSGPPWDPAAIVDADGKARALLQACERLGCEAGRAIAIGDGANDVPMLRQAGLSVAWHAKPVARAAARLCLDHCGLDGVLPWFGA